MKVAFQGERGAYSEMACHHFFGSDVETLSVPTFEDVFRAVTGGAAEVGVVPVENSYAGTVTKIYDLLLDYDLFIVGETYQRITHSLLGNRGARLEQILRVYSHPQAIAQCDTFLAGLNAECQPVLNTAGAAKQVKERGSLEEAAVCHEHCAEIYDLDVLKRSIESNPANRTRFVILSKRHLKITKNVKTSIVFGTKHIPAALYKCLGGFATNGVNLTKIESRPPKDEKHGFLFYLDLDGHPEDVRVGEALKELQFFASFVKRLGSYPKDQDSNGL
jgi:prephenate dehydratase